MSLAWIPKGILEKIPTLLQIHMGRELGEERNGIGLLEKPSSLKIKEVGVSKIKSFFPKPWQPRTFGDLYKERVYRIK
jgi:hypothetical protein